MGISLSVTRKSEIGLGNSHDLVLKQVVLHCMPHTPPPPVTTKMTEKYIYISSVPPPPSPLGQAGHHKQMQTVA